MIFLESTKFHRIWDDDGLGTPRSLASNLLLVPKGGAILGRARNGAGAPGRDRGVERVARGRHSRRWGFRAVSERLRGRLGARHFFPPRAAPRPASELFPLPLVPGPPRPSDLPFSPHPARRSSSRCSTSRHVLLPRTPSFSPRRTQRVSTFARMTTRGSRAGACVDGRNATGGPCAPLHPPPATPRIPPPNPGPRDLRWLLDVVDASPVLDAPTGAPASPSSAPVPPATDEETAALPRRPRVVRRRHHVPASRRRRRLGATRWRLRPARVARRRARACLRAGRLVARRRTHRRGFVRHAPPHGPRPGSRRRASVARLLRAHLRLG